MNTARVPATAESPAAIHVVRQCSGAVLAALIAGCATPLPPRESAWHPQPASPEELQAIATITATGRAIHRQDQFVWHASDAYAIASNHRPAPPGSSYAVTERDGLVRVSVLAEEHRRLHVLADVDMGVSAPAVTLDPAREPDEDERRQARARATALAAAPNVCGGARNTVVLPVEGGAMDVYVIAANNDAAIVPLGGHARVRVSADGGSVLAFEPYSKACLDFDTEKKVPSGGRRTTLMSTIVLSDLPAPTHVYTSLTFPWPIMLASKTHLWKVADGRITAVDPTQKDDAKPAMP
jgi:hypothetical protein